MMRGLPIRVGAAPSTRRRGKHRSDAGYALLAVVFFAGVMILAASVAAPVLLTQGKREKEEEMIWRGEQHVRAIKLYFRKYGKFPKAVEDLTEAKNGIHFLRKKFKDPMNKADGAWRFIYVGPGGQLIGSVTRTSITGIPQPPAAVAAVTPPSSVPPNLPPQRRLVRNPSGDQNPAPDEEGGSDTGTDTDTSLNPLPAAPAPPKTGIAGGGISGDGKVFGGSLIGVGSKVDKASIKFYKGYGKYKEWEFIWDPQAEAAAAAGVAPGAGIPSQTPGQQFGQPFGGPPGPQPVPTNPPQ